MKVRQRFYTLLSIIAFLLLPQLGWAAARDVVTEGNYERWKLLPGDTLQLKGSRYLYGGQIDSAIVCFTILSNRYSRQMTDTLQLAACADAKVTLGVIYADHLYDYQKAYQYILHAEEIAKHNNLHSLLSDVYLAKANLLYDLNYVESNYAYQPELTETYRAALGHASQTRNIYIETIAWANMAYLGMKHAGQIDYSNEAEMLLQDIKHYEAHRLETGQESQVPDSIIMKDYMATLAQAYLAFHAQDYGKALSLFQSMPDKILQQNDNGVTRYRYVAEIGQYFTLRAMGKDNEAYEHLVATERLVADHGLTHIQLEACRMRYDWLVEHHRDVEARQCLLEYLQLKDQFMQDSKLSKAESGKFLYELQNISDDMREQEHRSQTLKLILLGVIVFAVVVLALLALLAMKYREVRSKNRSLYQRMNELMEAEAAERKLLEQEAEATPEDTTKYRNNQMAEETKSQLMHRVFMVMETCGEVYQPDFTLARLSELVEATQNNVSQVINDRYHVNFNVFLAEYRVKEACRRMQDSDGYGNLSVEGIAASVGIKSRSNFSFLFKRLTGLTPAAYMRLARTSPESLPQI